MNEYTPWEAIDEFHQKIKAVEAEERHGNLTTEQAIDLIGQLMTRYQDLLNLYNNKSNNFAVVVDEKRGNLGFVQGDNLERYTQGQFDNVDGIRFFITSIEKELISLLLNQDLINNKAILQQILLGNVTTVEDILK